MKLYFSPGACSLSPHIVLREAGFIFDLEKVDLRHKKTFSGQDFNAINDKGYVPFLALDNGTFLSEGPAIVQYLADQKPESNLVPKPGTFERYQTMEWLNFISTELHKSIGALFSPINEEATAATKIKIEKRLDYVAKKLGKGSYLMGDHFTVADAYLFTVLRWTAPLKVDLARWPVFGEYMKNIAARPKVKEALAAEGIA